MSDKELARQELLKCVTLLRSKELSADVLDTFLDAVAEYLEADAPPARVSS